MTQPPYPPRPDQPQPPGWGPAPLGGYQGAPGYDPTRPLGARPPDSTNISEFAPPPSRTPILVGLAAVVVAILIAATATLQPGGLFGARPAPASPTPTPSATAALPGQPFATSDGRVEGRWQVVERRWTDEGVQVKVWVAVDRGTLRFSFLAFSNDAAEVVYPAPGADYPGFTAMPIDRGEERDGWLFFPVYRADLTLILANDSGRQISALVVPA
ncbi:MAG: hypothetical protein AAGC63_08425 [Propionicimonas sp.]|nr:hypothetical protein [Propionicimonas sp.]